MPLYYFVCEGPQHLFKLRRILTPEEAEEPQYCPCGALLVRVSQGATSTVREVLDNGLMARPVDRLSDAERLYRERSKEHK